jgi:hypothetical protein
MLRLARFCSPIAVRSLRDAGHVLRGCMACKASAAALMVFLLGAPTAWAEDCGREEMAVVVNDAGATLTAMNETNKRRFHEKLQQLKARRGWSDAEFVAQATPFIKDDRIAALDAENKALLARVPELGAGASVASLAAVAPGLSASAGDERCRMVQGLRQLMSAVIENSRSKWTYMLGKLDVALGDSAGGSATQ